MRVLVATTANQGHFGPLVSLARAFAAAGDEVRVAAPASFAATVAGAGFVHVPFADAPADLVGPVMAQLPSMSFDEADATVIQRIFAQIDAQAAWPAVAAAIEDWRPDLLVRESAEVGSLAAAVRAGVPSLQVACGMAEMSRRFLHLVQDETEPLAGLERLAGLPIGSVADAAGTEPVLSSVPLVLDRAGDAGFEETSVAYRYRDVEPTVMAEPLPVWGDPEAPLVYVTFGSVAGALPPFAGVFRAALDAVVDLPLRVFVTVGRKVDPASLGPLPVNAQVVPWWPQSGVLTRARAVWGHGGFGTTMGALAAGLPQLVTPLFTSDQRINARHVAAAGVGLETALHAMTAAGDQLMTVLADPAYADRARAVAGAINDLPSPTEAVAAAYDLIGRGRPR